MSQGSAKPLCVRTEGANRGGSEEKLIFNHGLFSSYESQRGAANGQDFSGVFEGCTGLWTAGCWVAPQLNRPKASTTMDLDNTNFLTSA